jgi:NAD(P)H dehydrogenase (quinone)
MKVGIIVYSQTGNTHSVAKKLKDKFAEAGNVAEIEQITITGEAGPGSKNFQLETIPEVGPYDAIVVAAPVQAFSLHPAMAAYLEQLTSLQGKEVACYVTKQLPGKWTGGNRAVARMKKICEQKGGTVCGSEIIVWNARRGQSIDQCADRLSSCFVAGPDIKHITGN